MADKMQEAIPYMDKILKEFPEHDEADLYHFIPKTTLSDDEKKETGRLKNEIEVLLLTTFKYAEKYSPRNYAMHLSDKGREAKKRGGHYKYEEWKNSQKSIQEETSTLSLQSIKKSIDELDRRFLDYEETKITNRQNKNAAIVAAIASVIAAIISVLPLLCNKSS